MRLEENKRRASDFVNKELTWAGYTSIQLFFFNLKTMISLIELEGDYRLLSRVNELLFLSWLGIHLSDRTAVFWGAMREFEELSRYDKLILKLYRIKQLNSFSMTDRLIAEFLDEINKFRPKYVYGYASSLHLIAQHINRVKKLTFIPVAVRSSAEALYDFQRQEIERAFQAPVYNLYGSREVNYVAAECPAHEGLHLFASSRIVEIVDDDGQPVPDGTAGNVAVTDLTNYAFPFIRYLIGDVAIKKATPCSCGKGYPLLESIQGRSNDMLIVNGKYLHGAFFTLLFYGRPQFTQFQVIQEDENTLRLLLVSKEKEPALDDLLAEIRRKTGSDIRIEVELTDHIPPSPSGKYRFTISRLHERK